MISAQDNPTYRVCIDTNFVETYYWGIIQDNSYPWSDIYYNFFKHNDDSSCLLKMAYSLCAVQKCVFMQNMSNPIGAINRTDSRDYVMKLTNFQTFLTPPKKNSHVFKTALWSISTETRFQKVFCTNNRFYTIMVLVSEVLFFLKSMKTENIQKSFIFIKIQNSPKFF